jgi:hypothetical protein
MFVMALSYRSPVPAKRLPVHACIPAIDAVQPEFRLVGYPIGTGPSSLWLISCYSEWFADIYAQGEAKVLMWPNTHEDLRAFIDQFENGTWPKDRWDHRAHITMALYYLLSLPLDRAIRRIKRGILDFNARQRIPNSDTAGYHETLTSFWISVLAAECARDTPMELTPAIQRISIRVSGCPDLWRQYYSQDVVRDSAARRYWIVPDLQSLPCAAAEVDLHRIEQ